MSEPLGDACDELLRKVDKLEATNGWLCAEVNRLTKERDELREKLSHAIGNAQDTLTLVDLDGEVIS